VTRHHYLVQLWTDERFRLRSAGQKLWRNNGVGLGKSCKFQFVIGAHPQNRLTKVHPGTVNSTKYTRLHLKNEA